MGCTKLEIKKRAKFAFETVFGFGPALAQIILLEHGKESRHSRKEYIMIEVKNVQYQIRIYDDSVCISSYDAPFELKCEVKYKYEEIPIWNK